MNGKQQFSRRWLMLALMSTGLALAHTGPTWALQSNPPSKRQQVIDLVVREAYNMGIPPALALALARAESDFGIYARSHKGARGIMQIMPIGMAVSGKDTIVPPDSVRRLAKVLEIIGHPDVMLVYRPELGHETSYADARAVLEFILEKSAARPRRPGS